MFRQFKKTMLSSKLLLLVCILSTIFLLAGCGEPPQDFVIEYVPWDFSDAETYAVSRCTGGGGVLEFPAEHQGKPVSAVLSEAVHCRIVEEVKLGAITMLEPRAFQNCGMKKIDLGQVRIISYNAFIHCDQLTTVSIPASIETIGDGAFADCPALTDVFFYGEPQELGRNIFELCPNVVLHGQPGGVIEAYAKEYGIPFEPMQ